ncbi:histone H4 transcription factor isoform X1 [Condylostylus longicornis]|uniref:histone H4 transcription factor isoform X1 n=1 Tax=Condylostylus longicornis TaxID=2530218 RepID=UPI00244E0502|nr:histone H4 transcription factor isoform X1 [Condylostylus longicornis]
MASSCLLRRSLRNKTNYKSPIGKNKAVVKSIKKKVSETKQTKDEMKFLYCRWDRNCSEKFTSNKKFHDHVEGHINEAQPKSSKYKCSWKFCNNFYTNCKDEFTRHCFYHVYLEILLRVGTFTKNDLNLPDCLNNKEKKYLVPDIKQNYTCQWVDCTYSFYSIILFHNHVREHCEFEFKFYDRSRKNKTLVKCGWEICKLKFKNLYRFKEHAMKHSNERILACPDCGQHLRTKTNYQDHCNRQLANNSQEFQCEQCFKFFSNERLFRIHFNKHVNILKCYLCDMTCSSSRALTLHISCRHLKEKPYKCIQCDYKSAMKNDIRKHMESVHENIIHECPKLGCSYSTKSKYKLQKHHSQIHENIPIRCYACHCCDKVYKSGNILSQHLIKVHSFQLPSGHKRFRYTMDENGMFRLQLTRIESLEVQQMLSPATNSSKNNSDQECKIAYNRNIFQYEIDDSVMVVKY